MSFIYASTLYPTLTQATFAAYADWITANGSTSASELADLLSTRTDDELVDEFYEEGWPSSVYVTEYEDGDRVDVPQAERSDWARAAAGFRDAFADRDDRLSWLWD